MSLDPQIAALVEEHAVAAALKAARLDAVTGDGPWSASLADGTLTLSGRTLHAELLGTFSDANGTFLWAWDHPSAPAGRTTLAERVRDAGRERGIGSLAAAYVPGEVLAPNEAAILGLALADGDAWWFGPGEQLAVLLIRDDALAAEPWSLVELPRMLMDLAPALGIDARRALAAFAAAPLPGLTAEPDGPDAFVVRSAAEASRIDLP